MEQLSDDLPQLSPPPLPPPMFSTSKRPPTPPLPPGPLAPYRSIDEPSFITGLLVPPTEQQSIPSLPSETQAIATTEASSSSGLTSQSQTQSYM